MAAALTWLCGGAGYTLHTGAGVRGGGAEDLARGRVASRRRRNGDQREEDRRNKCAPDRSEAVS